MKASRIFSIILTSHKFSKDIETTKHWINKYRINHNHNLLETLKKLKLIELNDNQD